MIQGKPGRDYVFNVTVKDADGAVVDLTAVTGLALIAYVKEEKVVQQWSMNAVANYDDMIVVDASAGLVRICLKRTKTHGLNEVKVLIEPVLQVDDVDFGDLQLSDLNGTGKELIYLTTTAREKMPDLA